MSCIGGQERSEQQGDWKVLLAGHEREGQAEVGPLLRERIRWPPRWRYMVRCALALCDMLLFVHAIVLLRSVPMCHAVQLEACLFYCLVHVWVRGNGVGWRHDGRQ